jgi:alpha-D-xyloside xylohydrolase
LYEDENDNYNYERGVYATIPIQWDEARNTLTIGARKGKFPGMLETRTFRIVFVAQDHGTGIGPTAQPDKVVEYSGSPVTVTP